MRRGQMVRCVVVAMVALGVAGVVAAREVTVKLKGGTEVKGEWIGQTDTVLTVRLANGAEKKIPRSQIEKIDERFSLKEEYRQKRSELDDKDYDGRFELARWLYKIEAPEQQREALQLALTELNDLLRAKPNEETTFLRDRVADKLKKLGATPDKPDEPAPPGEEPKPNGDGGVAAGGVNLLTTEQINRMKVFEVNLDTQPTVVIPPKVAEEFVKEYTRDPVDPVMKPYQGRDGEKEFKKLEGYEQLEVMFDVKARDYYDKVLVRDEPESLREFRVMINRNYLIRYCGACHGEGKTKGLHVVMTRPGQEQTGYTNLMLLATTEAKGLAMIMKDDPARSPLVQMGLPAKDAATPHPEVKGLKPYFRGEDDNNYRAMVAWIGSLYSDPKELVPGYEPFGGGRDGADEGEKAGTKEKVETKAGAEKEQ